MGQKSVIKVMIRGHWSEVTGQRSLVRGQGSLVTGQWSGVTSQGLLVSGQRSLVNGHWSNHFLGHWSVVKGHWSVVTGHWSNHFLSSDLIRIKRFGNN